MRNFDKVENDQINRAVNALKRKGVIIYPTDTVYGIGVLPDRNAIEKLYEIKKRDKSKKLIALIADISTINEVMDSTDGSSGDIEILEKIASVYWPGDLTVVIKAKKEITKIIEINDDESNESTIGERIPNNPIALEIIRQYNLAEKCYVYFSPVFGKIEPVTIVDFMKDNLINGARVQLQLHKFIWSPDKKGV